jgi:glycosyltransferase involved in cell wall biosynthesis
MNTPRRALTIVIPAHNEQQDLPLLLLSLDPLKQNPEVEIVVVDNGSTDGTGNAAEQAGARVVRTARLAPGKARNVGADTASGVVLAFLDADIVVTPAWIETALALGRALPAGEITGDTCDVSPQASWLERTWFGAIYRRGAVGYINSGNIALRADDFRRLGGFSTALRSGEDFDLCRRGALIGMSVKARREMHVHHLGYPRTVGQFVRREIWHGSGDFSSWRSFAQSPLAQAALVFAALHGALIMAMIAGRQWLAAGCALSIVALCAMCSFWKFRRGSPRAQVSNVPVCWLYLAGRALAVFGRRTSS